MLKCLSFQERRLNGNVVLCMLRVKIIIRAIFRLRRMNGGWEFAKWEIAERYMNWRALCVVGGSSVFRNERQSMFSRTNPLDVLPASHKEIYFSVIWNFPHKICSFFIKILRSAVASLEWATLFIIVFSPPRNLYIIDSFALFRIHQNVFIAMKCGDLLGRHVSQKRSI